MNSNAVGKELCVNDEKFNKEQFSYHNASYDWEMQKYGSGFISYKNKTKMTKLSILSIFDITLIIIIIIVIVFTEIFFIKQQWKL